MEAPMKWHKNRTLYLFGFMGFLGGVGFIVLGFWLEYNRHRLPLSWWSFLYLHRIEPITYILDMAPFVLAFMAALIGSQRNLSAAIIQGKKEWEIIFDSFSGPIFVTDKNNCIMRCNRAAIDLAHGEYADQRQYG